MFEVPAVVVLAAEAAVTVSGAAKASATVSDSAERRALFMVVISLFMRNRRRLGRSFVDRLYPEQLQCGCIGSDALRLLLAGAEFLGLFAKRSRLGGPLGPGVLDDCLVELLLECVAPFDTCDRRLRCNVSGSHGGGCHARQNDRKSGNEMSHRFLGSGSRRQFFRCQSAAQTL